MEKVLKTYNVNTNFFYDSIIVTSKETNGDCLLEYRCNDIFLTGRGDYPFKALVEIRKQLIGQGLILLCEGARKDVYPSGMAFTSFLAYKTVLGKHAGKENLVNILDPTDDINMIGSLEEQEEYRITWANSLGTTD